MLSISIGQQRHEGERLASMIRWINLHFKQCYIDLSDSLQRYNHIAAGLSEEDAWRRSLQDGLDWMERNQAALETLSIPYKVFHWDSWLKDAEFPPVRDMVQKIYADGDLFRDAVIEDAEEFVQRSADREYSTRALTCSISYILEELAVFTLMGKKLDATRVYPGRELKSAKILRARPDMPQMNYYTRINLESRAAA